MKDTSLERMRPARLVQEAIQHVSVAAIAALLGLALATTMVGSEAWSDAQDAGGHTDASHDDGGHDGGSRGKGPGGTGGHDDGHEEEDHADGHEAGGPRGSGGRGGGHDTGGHDDGDQDDKDSGSDGSGGRQGAANGGDGDRHGSGSGRYNGTGGTPVWAREGIPEVELGRLNVSRSPSRVLDRAFNEALASFTPEVAAFYRLSLPEMERELSENWESVRLIDSPLQNLALLRDALGGSSILATVGIATDNETLLAAFLGTASDKAIPVSAETAAAVSAILGQPLSPSEAAALAEKAERIRQAILEGHG